MYVLALGFRRRRRGGGVELKKHPDDPYNPARRGTCIYTFLFWTGHGLLLEWNFSFLTRHGEVIGTFCKKERKL